jgi:glycosyltransferase involved in cell wall biosynthesis
MRIAITFPFALGTPGGGTEDAAELARALAELGCEVTLVTADCSGPDRFPRRRAGLDGAGARRAERLAEAGVALATGAPNPFHFRLDGRGVRAALAPLLERRGADAVIGYWHEAYYLPPLARAHGALFAMTGAASFSQFFGPRRSPLERLRNARLARTYRAAELVFTRSRFSSAELGRYLGLAPERLAVVPLGVDPSFFALPRPPPTSSPGAVRGLVFVGRLVPSKGVFDALAALGELSRAGRTDWRLRVVGPGDADAVRRAAEEQGIAGRVELLGPLERPGLSRELARAELALLPTHTESFGLAVAEAQAAGLAVCAYRAGAVPEVVEHGVSGWLAEPGRPDELALLLARALADPVGTHRAGLAGRERAALRWSWRRAAEATLGELERARRRGRSSPAEARPAG